MEDFGQMGLLQNVGAGIEVERGQIGDRPSGLADVEDKESGLSTKYGNQTFF
jgi:hypothetical protein